MSDRETGPTPLPLQDDRYECVDPAMGEQLWKLEAPDVEPGLAEELRLHLQYCDACRIDRAAAARLTQFAPAHGHEAWLWRSVGTLLAAASLAGILLLPPAAPSTDVVRGVEPVEFLRPVQGEVVRAEGMHLSWTPVEGATRYRVRLESVGDSWFWEGATENSELEVPVDVARKSGKEVRAILRTVPEDLLAVGEVGVRFRVGSASEVLRQRLVSARWWLWLGVLAGIGLLAFGGRRRATATVRHPS